MRRTSLVVTLLAAGCVTGDGPLGTGEQSVIGGTAVPAGKWPDAVAVLSAQGSCTGTLIAPDVVLTAGHCADPAPTQIIANTTNYDGAGGIRATVKTITAYPAWETSYDVSVIVLTAPIAGVTPRPVGAACTFQGFGTTSSVHLVGFGATDTAGQSPNSRLNEATAPVTDPDCSGGNGCVPGVAPGGEFVAGGNGTDSCFGDSGGPVYLDTPRGTMVIGAVSRGLDNSPTPCGGGGIYVRTDKVLQWLETTTGKQIAKDSCAGGTPPPPPPGGGGDGSGNGDGNGNGNGGGNGNGTSGGDYPDVTGGCSTGSGAGLGAIACGLVLALRRRRRSAKAQD